MKKSDSAGGCCGCIVALSILLIMITLVTQVGPVILGYISTLGSFLVARLMSNPISYKSLWVWGGWLINSIGSLYLIYLINCIKERGFGLFDLLAPLLLPFMFLSLIKEDDFDSDLIVFLIVFYETFVLSFLLGFLINFIGLHSYGLFIDIAVADGMTLICICAFLIKFGW